MELCHYVLTICAGGSIPSVGNFVGLRTLRRLLLRDVTAIAVAMAASVAQQLSSIRI